MEFREANCSQTGQSMGKFPLGSGSFLGLQCCNIVDFIVIIIIFK